MLFFLTVAVLLVGAQANFHTDCGSTLATVHSIGVSDCVETAKECILKRNTNATMTIEFTPSVAVKAIETEVQGVIMGLPVPFPLPQPDACMGSGLTCPLQAGQKVNYVVTLPVLRSYPKLVVVVKWELEVESEQDLVCIMIKARIN